MLKVLIASVILAMLTGCVSPRYSSPGSAYRSYESSPRIVYRDPYLDAAYYPWWSVDYFYLGGPRYRPVYGSSFSFSLSSGYPYYGPYYSPGYFSPWYAPYRYYDPWFGPYYGWSGGYWRYDPYWRHAHERRVWRAPRQDHSRGDVRQRGDARGDGHAGYDTRGRAREDFRQGGSRDVRDRPPRAGSPPDQGRGSPAGTNRNVSVAPASGAADRGMIIVNRGDGKLMPSRVEPARRTGSADAAPPPQRAANPAGRPARSYSPPARSPQQDSGNDDKQAPDSEKHKPDKHKKSFR